MKPETTALNSLLLKTLGCMLVLAGCAVSAPAGPNGDELSLVITMVTGEHSKDSNSTTTRLTVSADKLVYEQSWQGAHTRGRKPVRKEYALTTADRNALMKVLREKNLLSGGTLAAVSEEDAVLYFSLVIHTKLNGRERSITVKGPRGAAKLKAERLYQNSILLVGQLYTIINRTDAEISMPGLIY